jgi:hypothetical protein
LKNGISDRGSQGAWRQEVLISNLSIAVRDGSGHIASETMKYCRQLCVWRWTARLTHSWSVKPTYTCRSKCNRIFKVNSGNQGSPITFLTSSYCFLSLGPKSLKKGRGNKKLVSKNSCIYFCIILYSKPK